VGIRKGEFGNILSIRYAHKLRKYFQRIGAALYTYEDTSSMRYYLYETVISFVN